MAMGAEKQSFSSRWKVGCGRCVPVPTRPTSLIPINIGPTGFESEILLVSGKPMRV